VQNRKVVMALVCASRSATQVQAADLGRMLFSQILLGQTLTGSWRSRGLYEITTLCLCIRRELEKKQDVRTRVTGFEDSPDLMR
jgi:hypothetical protein